MAGSTRLDPGGVGVARGISRVGSVATDEAEAVFPGVTLHLVSGDSDVEAQAVNMSSCQARGGGLNQDGSEGETK